MARLELCELGVVALGERMVALVDVPSLRKSPASRKLAIENAAIIWFEHHSMLATFMDRCLMFGLVKVGTHNGL